MNTLDHEHVKSPIPPVRKSGKTLFPFPFKIETEASINSIKLWGSIFVDNPTAIPSAPCANSKGNLIGKDSGSSFLPS